MTRAAAPPALQAEYFDGQHAAAHPVRLTIAAGELRIEGAGFERCVPVRDVVWPERQRHGQRQAQLPGHGLLSAPDAPAWDAWARASGLADAPVVRWQQNWRASLAALALLVLLLGAAYRWGAPAASGALLALCPPALDAQLGDTAWAQVEREWLRPTALSAARQDTLRAQFAAAVQRMDAAAGAAAAGPAAAAPWTLHFRAAAQRQIGANAFALPGGHIVVTDALVELLADRPDVLMGVLGHELGHQRHRHGMRALLQAGLLTALSSLVIGDFSTLLTAAPALLGQLAYAREAEHQADDVAARLMRANGWDPLALGLLFERLRAQRGEATELPIGLSTHPPDAQRLERLRSVR